MKNTCLAIALFLAVSAPSPVRAEEPHPLVWALALTPKDYPALTEQDLARAADWLWNWSYLGPEAPVTGTPAERLAALNKAREITLYALKRNPKETAAYARMGMINYARGEQMPPNTSKDTKLALYEEMIGLSQKCIDIDPKQAPCWHWFATGTGRRSTTKGLINSLMSAEVVEQGWLKVLALKPTAVLPNGDRIETSARYGLTVFYRMVPESWLIKMVAGTRGDKKKAIAFMRAAVATQPDRLELHKELGAALLCYGESNNDAATLAEGKKVLQAVVNGAYGKKDVRQTDPIDKQHSQELIQKPELACGYSRDGYQSVDESKLKK